MATKPVMFLTGDKELDRVLMQLEPKLQKQAMTKATREAAKVVQRDAIASVPYLTGALEKSLKVRTMKKTTRWERRNLVGHSVLTDDPKGMLFSGDTFYGGFIEYGWRHWRNGAPVEGDPFLRPALYSNAERAKQIARDEVRRFIRAQREKVTPK